MLVVAVTEVGRARAVNKERRWLEEMEDGTCRRTGSLFA